MLAEPEVACPWTFDDFCRWVYCVVDELWQPIAPAAGGRGRRPPAPTPSWWRWR
jgi:hypothetical protein